MAKSTNNKTKQIWLSVLILLVCVSATTVVFLSRMDSFLLSDAGAISLITDHTSGTDNSTGATEGSQSTDNTEPQAPTEQEPTNNTTEPQTDPTTAVTTPQATQPPKNPGFEASDDQTVWSTDTKVEIFRVSYENGEQVITVNSDDGDKVIAPGTDNSYIFKLKNTGNVALDYTVEVDAYFTPADIEIPITARLNRYDGKWIAGSQDAYAKVPVLDDADDIGILGAGKYTYYTLDWLWPFESGNDELDTMLGNLATEQDLIFTIVIRTTATESDDPNADGGITPPKTGDNTALALLITLSVTSFAMMVFLLIFRNKGKRRNEEEDSN